MNCRAIQRADTTPIRARKNTSAGIWKIAAMPSSIRMYRLNESSMRGMNETSSFEKLAKNRHMSGNAT